MKKKWMEKILTVGILVLFIGASVVPNIFAEKSKVTMAIDGLNGSNSQDLRGTGLTKEDTDETDGLVNDNFLEDIRGNLLAENEKRDGDFDVNFTLNYPLNGSIDVELNPELNVTVDTLNNTPLNLTFITPVSYSTKNTISASSGCDIHTIDLDGDEDIDIVGVYYTAEGKISWLENDGEKNFIEHIIENNFRYGTAVYAIDLDKDSDVDVLGSTNLGDIIWWENDGSQNFIKHIIDGDFGDGIRDLIGLDVDIDRDIDILYTSQFSNEIAWLNNNGNQSFTKHLIDDFFNGQDIYPIDIENDGDIDICGAAFFSGDIVWWENVGNETFIKHVLEDDLFRGTSVYAADLDSDGDKDILHTATGGCDINGEIAWWENNGNQEFTKHVLDPYINDAFDVFAMDMDLDHDVDILGAVGTPNERIVLWENNGYNQGFTKHVIDTSFDNPESVIVVDIDSDEDIDVLGSSRWGSDQTITWWENFQEILCQQISVESGTNATCIWSGLEPESNYLWRIVATDVYNRSAISPYWSFTTRELIPNLVCDGTLSWTEIKPGETVTGSFIVSNIGDPTSELNWEIVSYPDWGIWTFTPSGGSGLTPEDGAATIYVEVVAPDESEAEFSGEVRVVNTEDANDFCIVNVSLVTPVNQHLTGLKSVEFLRNFDDRFPLLNRFVTQSFISIVVKSYNKRFTYCFMDKMVNGMVEQGSTV